MMKISWPQAAIMMTATAAVGALAFYQKTEVAAVVTLMGLLWSMFQKPGGRGDEE